MERGGEERVFGWTNERPGSEKHASWRILGLGGPSFISKQAEQRCCFAASKAEATNTGFGGRYIPFFGLEAPPARGAPFFALLR